MALNSRQKRAAVVGVARPWYRNAHPSNVDASQRASIANVYPIAEFQNPVVAITAPLEIDLELNQGILDVTLAVEIGVVN